MGNIFGNQTSSSSCTEENLAAIALHRSYLKHVKELLVKYEASFVLALLKEFSTKFPTLRNAFEKNYKEVFLKSEPVPIKIHRKDTSGSVPYRATGGSAGFDVSSAEDLVIYPGEVKKIRTGITLQFPHNSDFFGLIQPRSSVGRRGLSLLASVIDPDYKEEIYIVLANVSCSMVHIKKGHRIAQIIFMQHKRDIIFLESESSFQHEYSHGGFGSTGV